jgi:hypothetical protein
MKKQQKKLPRRRRQIQESDDEDSPVEVEIIAAASSAPDPVVVPQHTSTSAPPSSPSPSSRSASGSAKTPSSVRNDDQEFESDSELSEQEEAAKIQIALAESPKFAAANLADNSPSSEPASQTAEKSSPPEPASQLAEKNLSPKPASLAEKNPLSKPAAQSAEKILRPADKSAENSPAANASSFDGAAKCGQESPIVIEDSPQGKFSLSGQDALKVAGKIVAVSQPSLGSKPSPEIVAISQLLSCPESLNPRMTDLLNKSKRNRPAAATAAAQSEKVTALKRMQYLALPAEGETEAPAAGNPAIAELAKQIERLAGQNAKMQNDLRELRQEAEVHREESEALILDRERLLQEVVEKQRQLQMPPPPSLFGPLQNPEYHQRFQWLVQKGWTMAEASEALEATKQGQVYSSARADAHLKAISDGEIRAAIQAANRQTTAKEDGLQIDDNSALAKLLENHTDAVDIVVKMKTTHANTKARAAHTAKTAVAAGNLVQLPSIQNDPSLARKGQLFLGQVALAVCEDCDRCADLRSKSAQEEREKARVKAAKEEQEAKKRQLQEEKAAEARKRAANRPVVVNFRSSDSKRDVTLPRLPCSACGKGWEGGKWLYHCAVCKRAYHEAHMEMTLFRTPDGREYWACQPCKEKSDGENPGKLKPMAVGSDIANGKAPSHQEALDDGSSNRDRALPAYVAPQIELIPSTPYHGRPEGSGAPTTATRENHSATLSTVQKELNFGTTQSALAPGVKPPTLQMKDYLIWEVTPKDWKAPLNKDGIPQDHPSCGWSKTAYQNWRRKNLNLQGSHVGGAAALGPLVRGISPEIQKVVGAQLMLHPENISHLWPNWQPNRPEAVNVEAWVAEDDAFSWVGRLPDATLLFLLDKLFGVERADTFLSRRFVPSLPPCDEQGEINYHSADFARWSTEWQTDLTELQRAGRQSLVGVDLRQTLLNALSGCSLLHDHASVLTTRSALIMLAAMRDWTMKKDEETITRRNERHRFMDNSQSKKERQTQPEAKPAAALHSVAQAQDNTTPKLPPSPNLKVCGKFGELVKCEGCGNVWNGSRAIPCSPLCRYADHPEFNREWKTKPYSRRFYLSWKGFRERFAHIKVMPPGLLDWEAKQKAYLTRKRAAGEHAEQPDNKKA